MNAENATYDLPEVEVHLLTELPGSRLGKRVVTAAAQTMLEQTYLKADYFFQWHESSYSYALDELHHSVSHGAFQSRSRIESTFFTEIGTVIVVTEPIGNAGMVGVGTRLLLAEEALSESPQLQD